MKTTGFLHRPHPENIRAIPGAVFHFLARGADTQGRHALMQITVQRGAEPPAHTHSHEDESYFIQQGRVRYHIGEQTVEAQAGDYVHLPQGLPHSFEVLTDSAQVLMLISPAGLDEWFWDHSAPAPDGQPLPQPQGPPPAEAIAEFVRTLGDYGVQMLPPGAAIGSPVPATQPELILH
ncbi:cupin domain-containing protein [Hymenobacter oligotrophus]|uniref:Cupin domain-containing protein n=1 Tax=Hymenobacter oligotrophus TaxID=2319843 RepID=A0A3B7R903_9BACT|nr:cupin domain-containing protein [Hymenobacter oligotrophus]AYA37601.1 cupin domain-containing protein [Hymenobacter oligotrophus]